MSYYYQDNRFTSEDAKIIRHKVHKLISTGRLNANDREDCEQELAMHISGKMCLYDPQRGARNTFVDRISSRKVAHILEHQHARKRRCPNKITSMDERSEAVVAAGVTPMSVELSVDVYGVLQTLPTELQKTAILLLSLSPADATRELGLTRGQFRVRLKSIRIYFENCGLNPAANNQRERQSGK